MLLTTILLAISSSIDSLGIGITYGVKNTEISFKGKLVIFFISFIITLISLYFGSIIKTILPSYVSDYLGSFIFIIIGIFICFGALRNNKEIKSNDIENILDTTKMKNNESVKTYSFFIKFLGITVKIIKDATSSDLDNSKKIDSKEALFLSIVLSIDSICVGIGGGIIDLNNYIFPILIGVFQLFFLSLGTFLGKKIYKFTNLPNNIWSIISGILLIFLGILKLML